MRDPKTEAETHMEWEGHTSLADAKVEYEGIRRMSFQEKVKPLDGYVYEADVPEYGNKPEKLDMAKFAKHFENVVLHPETSQPYEIVQS
jgi:hypothetical protein